MAMKAKVSTVRTERWFNVDWETVSELRTAMTHHEEIFDAMLSLKNASEVNSGHTGFNVGFINDARADQEIRKSIKAAVEAITG